MYYRDENNEWQEIVLEPSGDTLPIGSIAQFGGAIAPTNWLICNGQAVSRETYSELFAVIGTTYGEGNGSTTFNLPDFSSRSPMGLGTGTDGTNSETTTLGQEKGEYKHKLTVNEMPKHNHKLDTYFGAVDANSTKQERSRLTNAPLNGNAYGPETRLVGEDEAHNTIHPVLGINFIIKAKQSIGVLADVTRDINDTNDGAVPNANTVKDYVDTLEDRIIDAEVYSTNEVKTNKVWIDGKPIYRKVFIYNNVALNSSAKLKATIDAYDFIIKSDFYYKFSQSEIRPFPTLASNGTALLQARWGNNEIAFSGTDSWSAATDRYVIAILEYTKTTN